MERSGAAPRRAVCEWPGRAVPAGRGGGGLGGRSGGVGGDAGAGHRPPARPERGRARPNCPALRAWLPRVSPHRAPRRGQCGWSRGPLKFSGD